MSVLRKSDYFLLISFIAIALASSFYAWTFGLVPEIRGLFNTKPDWLLQSSWYIPVFLVHVFLAGIAMLAGSTQFVTHNSNKLLSFHRFLGKVYFFTTVPSGLTGLLIAFFATGSWFSKGGFITLAIGWIGCTLIGLFFIRNKKINEHREWMIRSYAFCLAFVTFRIYLGLGEVFGLKFDDYYSYLSFLSWIPNLIFAEYLIKRKKIKTAL